MPAETIFSLSGADAFFLALSQHQSHNSLNNNCFYILEIEGKLSSDELKNSVEKFSFQNINDWKVNGENSFGNSYWISQNTNNQIPIRECQDLQNHFFLAQYELALNISLSKEDELLAILYAYNDQRNTTTVILKWDHLVMDGAGSWLFLMLISGNIESDKIKFIPEKFKSKATLWQLYRLVRFISNTSHQPIFQLNLKNIELNTPSINLIEFNIDQSKSIYNYAEKNGAAFNLSSYFLASICQTMHAIFPETEGDFWVPLPVNIRKKGALGPLLSNQLSSYFYRIKRSQCNDKSSIISALKDQLTFQINNNYPRIYLVLTHFMKYLPTSISHLMIRGWKRKSYASFLFTMSQPHKEDFSTFLGGKIVNALSIPPNSNPPGLTFVVMQSYNTFKLAILSRNGILNQNELTSISEKLKSNILE